MNRIFPGDCTTAIYQTVQTMAGNMKTAGGPSQRCYEISI
jgi:hypothetical protein